jgi:hypothetical protein
MKKTFVYDGADFCAAGGDDGFDRCGRFRGTVRTDRALSMKTAIREIDPLCGGRRIC